MCACAYLVRMRAHFDFSGQEEGKKIRLSGFQHKILATLGVGPG